MKRLFYYIPELMLAAGVLLAAGILITCKCPRLAPPKYHGAAPIVGLGVYPPKPAQSNVSKCPNGMVPWASNNPLTGAPESACLDIRSAAELYGKWMQVRPTVESCDGQNLMVHCW